MGGAYINYQGGTKSTVVAMDSRVELHVPAISAFQIPGVDNWQARL